MKKNKNTNWLIASYPFILFIAIVLFISRKFLFYPGHILYGEFYVSQDYSFFVKEFIKPWSDYSTLGHSNIGFPTSYGNPVFFVTPPGLHLPWLTMLAFIQLFAGQITPRIHLFFAMLVPFIGMYIFAKYWFTHDTKDRLLLNSLATVASLIYGINFLFGDRLFAAHLIYNFGYGLLPLFLLCLFKANEIIEGRQYKIYTLLSGLLVGTFLWLMPHLLIIALFPLGCYVLLFLLPNIQKLTKFIITFIFAFLMGFLLNIHAWLPAIFFSEQYPFIADSTYFLSFVYQNSEFTTFDKLIALTSSFEKKYVTGSYSSFLIYLRLLIPLFAIGGFIISKKKKGFFALLLLFFGIVLGMGVNFPFEQFYIFLYKNISLFKPLRDVSKFFILYIFGLSLLIPYLLILLHSIHSRLVIPSLLFFAGFLLFVNPLFNSGDFLRSIIPFTYPQKYDRLQQFLSKQHDDFRVSLFPNDSSTGNYQWYPKLTNGAFYPSIYSLYIPLAKSIANSNRTVSDYSSRYLDYLEVNLDKSWAIAKLADEMVRYIIVDHSLPGYQKVLKQLEVNKSLSKIDPVEGFTIFKINNTSSETIKQRRAVYYFGDTRGLQYMPSNLVLINVDLNPLDILRNNYSKQIVLYNSSLEDVVLTSLSKFRFSYFPQVRFTVDGNRDFIFAGEWLRQYIINGVSFHNPEAILTVGNSKIEKKSTLKRGNYNIFLSVYNNTESSKKITLRIGEKRITKNIASVSGERVTWIDYGDVRINKDNFLVGLENGEKKLLIIDSLLIVPEQQYLSAQKRFANLIADKRVIHEGDNELDKSIFNNAQSIYVVSRSYSPFWDICKQKPFLVNFYATGTTCKQKSDIKQFFRPTYIYYVSIALTIAGYIFTAGYLSYLLLSGKRKNVGSQSTL